MTENFDFTSRLQGKVALVTGASRGVGKGVAIALGASGATVYVTGRTRANSQAELPGTIDETAALITEAGGTGIAVQCDHADDSQVAAVFSQIQEAHGKLDILVNNVFALPSEQIWGTPFWEQPLGFWDTMHTVGLRSHYVAAVHAAKMMVPVKQGLIIQISSYAAASYQLCVSYSVGKGAVDRLSKDMAVELRDQNISSISLWPGIVRTERVLAMGDDAPFPTQITESAQYTGRAIVALACDDNVLEKHTGKSRIVAELAQDYQFDDIDGTRPPSLRRPKSKRTKA